MKFNMHSDADGVYVLCVQTKQWVYMERSRGCVQISVRKECCYVVKGYQ